MFLRNGWYSAIWSHELTDKPVGKTFLNEKVVLFGTTVARSALWKIAAAIAPRRCRSARCRVRRLLAAITV